MCIYKNIYTVCACISIPFSYAYVFNNQHTHTPVDCLQHVQTVIGCTYRDSKASLKASILRVDHLTLNLRQEVDTQIISINLQVYEDYFVFFEVGSNVIPC